MNELVVISGKGGTGKTSLSASFAVLAGKAVIADCDVDAADLHLLLAPRVLRREEFRCGHTAVVDPARCTGCGQCISLCRFDALHTAPEPAVAVCADREACEGCGVCVRACPVKAIRFVERLSGEWMVSDTRCGTLVHARLHAGGENSGKLVSTVRREARALAEQEGAERIITDGPPGIGCPVIACLSGASQVLVVTEPTVSGEHDLQRVLKLARHFSIPAAICVNKWDLNPEMTARIERFAEANHAVCAGRVRYDAAVTTAQLVGKTVVETGAAAGGDIRAVWSCLQQHGV